MRPGSRPAPPRKAAAGPTLPATMAGAVDLAAVKARSEAAARAAEAPAPGDGQYVVDVTEATFQTEVLDRSFQVPVVLVVTSARVPQADPMISYFEAVATEGKGAIVFGTIDADAEPRIVQALQVQAVPVVFAVIGGQLVPGFEGVLPDDQLREFLGAVLQAADKAGLTGPGVAPEPGEQGAEPEPPEDPRFDAAEDALAAGDFEGARLGFQAILDVEPANAAAALALRQVGLLQRIGVAPDASLAPAANDVPGQLAAADLELAADQVDPALRRLLDLIARVFGEDRDAVRERLIDYFELLGPDDPRVGPARREMARALF